MTFTIAAIIALLAAFAAGFTVGASWERGKPIKDVNQHINDLGDEIEVLRERLWEIYSYTSSQRSGTARKVARMAQEARRA